MKIADSGQYYKLGIESTFWIMGVNNSLKILYLTY